MVTKTQFEKDPKNWGLLAIVTLYGCVPEKIRNKKMIEEFVIGLCETIDMKRFGEAMIERFAEGELEGISMMQFIETSSVTAHFDETLDRAFIEIHSCKYFNAGMALRYCANFFGSSRQTVRTVIRK